ncbi:uncharacterized protein GGS22DRAFT_176555, partial [Annulohypoxylon maeteangense]|uniref:uncharacterized protein n=1 Tax=Annulohypoxylon maeteangense TaxID=1927788 RepID=UPI002008A99F
MKASKAKAEELHAAKEEYAVKLSAEQSKTKTAEERCSKLEKELAQKDKQISQKAEELEESRAQLDEKEEQKSATQTELDDLLMVFGDIEEKVEKYKKRLIDLGETVSDGEDENEDDDDEDENEDDDDDDDV